MKTAEIINHNLVIPEAEKELVGDNQVQINVFEDGVEIEQLFVNTIEEAEAEMAEMNPVEE